ncbi:MULTISPECIES: hypothetical protein [Streptomyces]|uniref:Uncharacterized protein n=1 Tax=Streptomyces kaempferi TaxID=333725 RepID=A0ABW3XX39_9ACTN|nr:hypothetical protein [Streptomyces sp. NBC_01462]
MAERRHPRTGLTSRAANPVLTTEPAPDANEWHHTLWARTVNSGIAP